MSPEATYVLQSLATIAVFGGALYVATWGLRRLSGARGRGPLEILARQQLDGRRAVYLVRVGKRVLIVGAADGALTRLGSTSLESIEKELHPVPVIPNEPSPRSFRETLARALTGRERRPKDESEPS